MIDAIRPMEEDELIAILREEDRDAASFYSSELALAQAEAMKRYNAEPYGDEVEGRSGAVTHDVEDAVNWLMPHLMRLFIGQDDLITIEDIRTLDPDQLEQIAEYLTFVLFKDNSGEEIVHDFAQDGLLARIGIIRVAWEEPTPKPPKTFTNVPAERLAEFLANPEYEIVSQSSEDDQTWDLEVIVTPRTGRIVIEQVPPEEFAFSSQAASIEAADYHRRTTEEYVADLATMYPDKADALDSSFYGLTDDDADELENDYRRITRHQPETTHIHDTSDYHRNRRKVDLHTEYLRIDYDGDGIVELRQIKRVGNTILENIVVEESEFVSWSPIRLSHKLVGRSIADVLKDIQQIRTVITRKLLDSLGQSLAPRRVVNKTKIGEEGVDQLLDHDIGDVIECEGSPTDAIHELVTPDVSGSAYQALEYMDQRAEEASGVTRHAQGLKPEAITDTARGINALQTAANSRIELIGRWLGAGVEKVLQRVYRLSVAHQDGPRVVPLNGQPTMINPQTWSEEARIQIHVGMAAESREARMMKLGIIAGKQEQILMQLGPDNALLSLREYRNTLAAMTREAGFRSPERFFKDIPDDFEMPAQENEEDREAQAKMAEAQAKMQIEQMKTQAQLQIEQAKAAAQAQLEEAKAAARAQEAQQKLDFDQALAAAKTEADQALAELKFTHEAELNAAKLASEQQIAELRIASEEMLARERMAQERELAEMRISQEADLARREQDVTISAGNRPGGALDA